MNEIAVNIDAEMVFMYFLMGGLGILLLFGLLLFAGGFEGLLKHFVDKNKKN